MGYPVSSRVSHIGFASICVYLEKMSVDINGVHTGDFVILITIALGFFRLISRCDERIVEANKRSSNDGLFPRLSDE